MATWVFEPGDTAAGFCVRHMIVTWVRGRLTCETVHTLAGTPGSWLASTA